MKAAIFLEPGRIVLEEKPIPPVGPRDALLRVTTTTICGTDVHILKGEYPVARGLTMGHEPVGVIQELGSAVAGYRIGQRVIADAITPCGQCHSCLDGNQAQCGSKAMGGWSAPECVAARSKARSREPSVGDRLDVQCNAYGADLVLRNLCDRI
jgi:alcohol dehydrogenase